jgi:hypothetical protein
VLLARIVFAGSSLGVLAGGCTVLGSGMIRESTDPWDVIVPDYWALLAGFSFCAAWLSQIVLRWPRAAAEKQVPTSPGSEQSSA